MQTIYAFSYNPVIATGTNTTGTNWRMAYQQPIMLYKGTSNTFRVVVFSVTQKVVNLTGYDVQIQIVDRETEQYFITKNAVIDSPTAGVATVTLTDDELGQLQHRFYHIIARLINQQDNTINEILYLDDNYGAFTPVTVEDAWNYNEAPAIDPNIYSGSIYGNLIPGQNNTYSIGNSTLRWDHIYANIGDIGNINITNNSISSTTSTLNFGGQFHWLSFTDVSLDNPESDTGAILKFDETSHGDGPTFETWYGNIETPWDPIGQHSLDIRAANDISYVELASHDWNNYVGVNNDDVKIWTNWNTNHENFWTFGKNGWFTLPTNGRMISSSGNTSVLMGYNDIRLITTDVDGSTLHTTMFDQNGDVHISGNLLPGWFDTGPGLPNTIGTLEHPWKSLYLTDNIYINGIPLTLDSSNNLVINGNVFSGGGTTNWDSISGKPTFATVATSGDFNDLSNVPASFSGNYNDLSNKPNIPNLLATGNVIPSANVTYSLGNVNYQWKDLYVSNTTIYMNNIPLSITEEGNLVINGNTIVPTGNTGFNGNLIYNLNGQAININGNDSGTGQAYVLIPADANAPTQPLSIGYGNNTWSFNAQGDLILPDFAHATAIISSNIAPTRTDRIWYNTEDGRTYINNNNQWVDTSPQITQTVSSLDNLDKTLELQSDGSIKFADDTVQETAFIYSASNIAPDLTNGTLWFNSDEGRLYVNYNNNWMDANPQISQPLGIVDQLIFDNDYYISTGIFETIPAYEVNPVSVNTLDLIVNPTVTSGLRIYPTINESAAHVHLTSINQNASLVFGSDSNYIRTGNNNDMFIGTGGGEHFPGGHYWLFSNNGDLILPNGGTIRDTSNNDLLSSGSGGGAITINNGDESTFYNRIALAVEYWGAGHGYKQIIHTRHNSGTSINNAWDFYTSDGTQNNSIASGSIHGLTITNGRVGIANLNPAHTLDVSGDANVSGNLTTTRVSYPQSGLGAPTSGSRSAGTKITLWPELESVSGHTDYAIGMESYNTWFSVPYYGNDWGWKWYGGTTLAARLDGLGTLQVNGRLQTLQSLDFMYGGYPYMGLVLDNGGSTLKVKTNISSGDYTNTALEIDRTTSAVTFNGQATVNANLIVADDKITTTSLIKSNYVPQVGVEFVLRPFDGAGNNLYVWNPTLPNSETVNALNSYSSSFPGWTIESLNASGVVQETVTMTQYDGNFVIHTSGPLTYNPTWTYRFRTPTFAYGYYNDLAIGSNEKTWTFNQSGQLVFPDGSAQTTAYDATSHSWTPIMTNVTQISGRSFKNTGGTNGVWDAPFYSAEGYTRGCLASASSPSNALSVFGLTSNPAVNNPNIEYAFIFAYSGGDHLEIVESGVNINTNAGSFTPSTVAKIVYDGTNVNYYIDDVLVHTTARSPGRALHYAANFYYPDEILNNVRFEPYGIQSPGAGVPSDVPTHSYGKAGDIAGMVAYNSGYVYYCTANYDGSTQIWKRVAWSNDTW